MHFGNFSLKDKRKKLNQFPARYTFLFGILDVFLILYLPTLLPSEMYFNIVTISTSILVPLVQIFFIKDILNVRIETTTDPVNDGIRAYPDDYTYSTIKTAGTSTISYSYGHLKEIRIAGGLLGKITIFDGLDALGAEIVPAIIPYQGQVLKKDCRFHTGLTIVTETDMVVTLSYR